MKRAASNPTGNDGLTALDRGKGPVVVLAHSYLWGAEMWRPQIDALSRHYRVIVPNLWGLWNIFFIASHQRTHLSIGVHGAILPLILAPLGILLTSALDFTVPGLIHQVFPIAAPVALITYYLVWKYFVSSLNQILGIS